MLTSGVPANRAQYSLKNLFWENHMGDHSFLLTEGQARRRRTWLRMLALSILSLSIGYVAISRQNGAINGLTSSTSSGCSCHGINPSASTTLAVTGSTSVNTGSTTSYTATVSNSGQSGAGIDIGVKTTGTGSIAAGTLAASNTDLQLNGNELTHTAPKSMTSGSASFAFTWTAPTTPGTYYIQAAGNAVNLDGTFNSDLWNWLSPVAITVNGVEVTAPNGGESWCPGSTQNITWTSTGVTNVKIESSPDGTNWTTLIASTSAAAGSWGWAIPANFTPGTYRIRISDAANGARVDQSNATFTIGSAPSISTHPSDVTICQGQTANLSVGMTSTSGLTFQWRKNGNNVNGATSSTYSIPNAQPTASGTYDVVVTGSCGTVTSNSATLTVNGRPQITTQPATQSICAFEPATFSVVATGADLTYQWKKNGTDISGATTSSYTIGSVSQADTGTYSVVVSGSCTPSVTSNNAVLTMTTPPLINTQPPTTLSVCEGEAMTLTVAASGSNLTYQWRKNGTNINDTSAKKATFTIPSVTAANAGRYDVVVKGACTPQATSTQCTVTVAASPAITTQPTAQTTLVGSNVSFTVSATGTSLTYQWRKNGTPISNATSATLSLTNVQHSAEGTYDVRVQNRCDTVISTAVALTVKDPGAGARLSLSESSVDFGSVAVSGSKDQTLTALITNNGDSVLNVTGTTITGTDAGEFSIVSGGAPFTLAPNASQTMVLRFSPTSAGPKSAVLNFASNAAVNPTLPLQGNGSEGGITVDPSSLSFDSVSIGEHAMLPLIYCNSGSAPLVINAITLAEGVFMVATPPVTPLTLAPGECDTIDVHFVPTTEGPTSAELMVVAMIGAGDTTRVPLSGIGRTVAAVRENRSTLGSMSVVPNPTRGEAVISLSLAKPGTVQVSIVDAAGRTVRSHSEDVRNAGDWRWVWDGNSENGSNCPSGSYQILLRVGGSTVSQSLLLVR